MQLVISKELPRPQSATAGPGSNPLKRFFTFLMLKAARVVWFWRLYVHHKCQRVLAVVCFILTGLVIWSEVTLGIPLDLSPFGKITQVPSNNEHLDFRWVMLEALCASQVPEGAGLLPV